MPLSNFLVSIVGHTVSTPYSATVVGLSPTATDFSTPTTAATSGHKTAASAPSLSFAATSTAGARTGSGAADLDFSGGHAASWSITVDGGSPQTVSLSALYGSVTALKSALNAQLTGAVFSGSGTLTLTSNTKGHLSSIAITKTEVDSSLKIADGTTTGLASEKIIFKVNGGSDQTLYLENDYADVTALMAYLTAHTTGATWTLSDTAPHVLTLTTNTSGASGSINITTDTKQSTPTLGFSTGSNSGAAAVAAYVAAITIDGGSPQDLVLNADYNDWDSLITELDSQTTGATWSVDQFGILTVTSSTTSITSEVELVITHNSTDLGLPEADNLGGTTVTTGATQIWPRTDDDEGAGSSTLPQQVQIQNAGTSGDMATGANFEIGGPDVTWGEGIIIRPGASETVPLEVFEKLFATAENNVTVVARVLVTRA